MIDKRVVIDLAKSQIGYHEKKTNDQLDDFYANAGSNNWTKYARDLDAIDGFYNGKKNGYAWCDMFVDWCFVRAYGPFIGLQLLCQPLKSAGAGCMYSAQYYEQHGQFFTSNPKPGDQIFFDYGGGINHTGIIVEVGKYSIITVEGNADEQVKQCAYPFSANYIAGFGRPNWEMDGEPAPAEPDESSKPASETVEVTISLPILSFGDESIYVKMMQMLLINKGYSCGIYGSDGEYGEQTKIALYQFQKTNGFETNCICNKETWEKLLT